jgi:DNA-binding XRE family transcriptional regulator
MKIKIEEPSKLKIGGFIKRLRKKFFLTQDEVAKKIGVSRPTYNKIESNKAEITLEQAKRLADFFNVGVIDILSAQDTANNNIRSALIANSTNKKVLLDEPKSLTKLAQAIHYIYYKLVANPDFVEPVVHKLIFLIDYNYFSLYNSPLFAVSYIKKKDSPIIQKYDEVINQLQINNKLELILMNRYKFPNQKFLPITKFDLSNFSANALLAIDQVLATYVIEGLARVEELIKEVEPLSLAQEEELISIYPH